MGREKMTNWRDLIDSFLKSDKENNGTVSDLSDEDNIKRCKEISKQVKEDFLKSVIYRSTLEAMFGHTDKKTLERVKIDRSDKDRNKLTMDNIKPQGRGKKDSENEIIH